jgi:UDP-GlcNAc3NAcA epimerase
MKVLTIVGARPQFIKARPVSAALAEAGVEEFMLHTGQHYDHDMSGQFFTELGLRAPDTNLGVGAGSHASQTARMLTGIEEHLLAWRPDAVLVYGDTNSTAAGALAAAKLHIPVAHVEAGLRSYNRRMPEEINRVVTDHLSSRLYCPAQGACDNLAREGITGGVQVVGDVMHDALQFFLPLALQRPNPATLHRLSELNYYVATLHRADLTDNNERLCERLSALGSLDLPVVLPLHPRTRDRLDKVNWRPSPDQRLHVLPPLGYLDMLRLVSGCRCVITDSGGLQKEAYWLAKPCFTLREETEWTETVAAGWNHLVGMDTARLHAALQTPRPSARPQLYGSGDAAQRIARDLLGLGQA